MACPKQRVPPTNIKPGGVLFAIIFDLILIFWSWDWASRLPAIFLVNDERSPLILRITHLAWKVLGITQSFSLMGNVCLPKYFVHPTIKAHDNLCFPLRRDYLLLLSSTLCKSHGDFHLSFFILSFGKDSMLERSWYIYLIGCRGAWAIIVDITLEVKGWEAKL